MCYFIKTYKKERALKDAFFKYYITLNIFLVYR